MPLFGRRASTLSAVQTAPAAIIDPATGDPDAVRPRDATAAWDRAAARATLDGRDHDDLSFLLDVAADVPDSEQWLPEVVHADLRDTVALLAYGIRAIAWAWHARTGLRAMHVSQDQFAVFHERLRLAEGERAAVWA